MGTIKITHGQEFKYIRNCFGESDVFLQQYKLAASCLEEIVRSNSHNLAGNEDCLNNIIAFTGNRGQGKTSAMLTFTNELMHNKVNSQIRFGEITNTIQFLELELIDPSTFEDMHNVVEVIITKMYNAYMEEWRKRKKADCSDFVSAGHKQILENFQLVYEGLSLVRNPRKFDDLEQDYEGTIAKIARAGDSAKLKHNMQELVDKYLKFFIDDGKVSFLIVPIDDLDVNISLAYKMMEQIRKYLVLPNVILIMAVKIDQLRYCVELQFRKDMALLIDKEQRIFDQEPIDMATKYVAKLIPDARKIALPELHLLVNKDEEEPFEVEYLINGRNLFAVPEESQQIIDFSFEDKLLTLIYRTTGLVFVRSKQQVHPLMPQTLRELVNLASILGKMDPHTSLKNLEIFEDYFINTWIPSQLDDGYVRNIRSLFLVQTPALHLVLCSILLDKLENLDAYTLDTIGEEDKKRVFSPLKKFVYEKSQTGFSLGDVVSLLNFIENRYTDQSVKLFVFSVRTVYSIIMRKMVLNEQNSKLSIFVGDSVFGKSIVPSKVFPGRYVFDKNSRINDMVQSSASEKASRAEFAYDARTYLGLSGDYLTRSVEKEQIKEISLVLFFSDFRRNFEYFTSGNNAYDKEPTFSLENIFISPLFNYNIKFSANSINSSIKDSALLEYTPNREVISKATTNLEFLEFLYDYCSRRKDPGRTATDAEHIRHLLNNLNDAAKRYLLGNLFDIECVEWVSNSFDGFWKCRIDTNIILSADDINILRQNIRKCAIGKICINRSFQKRASDILKICENDVLNKSDEAQHILAQIKGQLSFSLQQDVTEKIDKTLMEKFNNYLNDLLKILDKLGDAS